MQTTQAPQTEVQKAKRNIKTRLFLVFKRNDTHEQEVIPFDDKIALDLFIDNNDVTPMSVIRGVEKKVKTRIIFA